MPRKVDTNYPTLEQVRIMSRIIQDHQEQIIKLGKQRRKLVMDCRTHHVTYREIASAMNASEQNVYKIIRLETHPTENTTP